MAGEAGGRRIVVPQKGTRPTADRVREALFSSLSSRMDFDGSAVLDLYAGSGALGLEALSRGADHALFVESDARAAAVITRNVETVGLPGATIRSAPVAAVLTAGPERQYDLVMADPPYNVTDLAVRGVLASLVDGGWLAPDALVVVERSSRAEPTEFPAALSPVLSKKYGEARIEVAEHRGAEDRDAGD